MSAMASTLDRRIFHAYQQVKKARQDGNYAAIIRWMTRVDQLLDERVKAQNAAVTGSVAPLGHFARSWLA